MQSISLLTVGSRINLLLLPIALYKVTIFMSEVRQAKINSYACLNKKLCETVKLEELVFLERQCLYFHEIAIITARGSFKEDNFMVMCDITE